MSKIVVPGHTLVDVSWVTHKTVGYEGGLPVREPIGVPHSRWYCDCGLVSGRVTGPTKSKAQAAAKRDHARHAAECDKKE